MIYVNYICNGCGLYTSYKGKNERQLNIITADLTNYLIMTSGFILKEPRIDIHFCDSCYSKIKDGSVKMQELGEVEVMRKKISELEKDYANLQGEFFSYKATIKSLIGDKA